MTIVLAVLVAAVVAFVLSGGWYAALGSRLAALSPAYDADRTPPRPAAATPLVELVRNLVLAAAVAWLADRAGVTAVGPALLLALVLWLAFPVVLLAGSVFHERVPPLLAAIHAGDWGLKLAAVTVGVALWT